MTNCDHENMAYDFRSERRLDFTGFQRIPVNVFEEGVNPDGRLASLSGHAA